MIDIFLLKFFGGLDKLANFLFGWMEPKKCKCNINNKSGNRCKRCGCLRKK